MLALATTTAAGAHTHTLTSHTNCQHSSEPSHKYKVLCVRISLDSAFLLIFFSFPLFRCVLHFSFFAFAGFCYFNDVWCAIFIFSRLFVCLVTCVCVCHLARIDDVPASDTDAYRSAKRWLGDSSKTHSFLMVFAIRNFRDGNEISAMPKCTEKCENVRRCHFPAQTERRMTFGRSINGSIRAHTHELQTFAASRRSVFRVQVSEGTYVTIAVTRYRFCTRSPRRLFNLLFIRWIIGS